MFENFRDMYLKTYDLDAPHFYSAPGLVSIAALKMTNVHLKDTDMVFIAEEEIRQGTCHSVLQYVKTNNKYITNHDKNEDSSNFLQLGLNNVFEKAVSQNRLGRGFNEFNIHPVLM